MNGLAQVPHTNSFPFIIILICCWGGGGVGGGMNGLAQVPHPDLFVFIIILICWWGWVGGWEEDLELELTTMTCNTGSKYHYQFQLSDITTTEMN